MKLEMKVARVKAHLKQADVAVKMGVSAVMVHYWETGVCKISEDRLSEYCAIIGCRPDDIILPSNLN